MDILELLSGINIIYQITCLLPCVINRETWTLRESKLLEIYTKTIIAASSLFLFTSPFTNILFIQEYTTGPQKEDLFVQRLGICVAYLVSISEALFRKKQHMKIYEKIKQIDRIFDDSLNIDVKNKEFHRTTQTLGFLMIFIYLAAELLYMIPILSSNSEKKFMLVCILNCVTSFVCGLRYFQMFTVIRILKQRLHLLASILSEIYPKGREYEAKNLNLKHNTSVILEDRTTINGDDRDLKKLLTVRDLYNRLSHLNEIISCCFGVSMLINIVVDFIFLISYSYWTFRTFHDILMGKKFMFLMGSYCVWSLPHIWNLSVLVMLSDSTAQKAKKIVSILHSISSNIWNEDENIVIQHFTLQLLHQKISINAAGFLTVDCSLLYMIMGAIATYLAIFIQFHLSEDEPDPSNNH